MKFCARKKTQDELKQRAKKRTLFLFCFHFQKNSIKKNRHTLNATTGSGMVSPFNMMPKASRIPRKTMTEQSKKISNIGAERRRRDPTHFFRLQKNTAGCWRYYPPPPYQKKHATGFFPRESVFSSAPRFVVRRDYRGNAYPALGTRLFHQFLGILSAAAGLGMRLGIANQNHFF